MLTATCKCNPACLSNQRLLTICSSLHPTRSLKQSVIAYKPRTLNSLWLLNARKHLKLVQEWLYWPQAIQANHRASGQL